MHKKSWLLIRSIQDERSMTGSWFLLFTASSRSLTVSYSVFSFLLVLFIVLSYIISRLNGSWICAIKFWTFSWFMLCSNCSGELFFITDRHNGFWNLYRWVNFVLWPVCSPRSTENSITVYSCVTLSTFRRAKMIWCTFDNRLSLIMRWYQLIRWMLSSPDRYGISEWILMSLFRAMKGKTWLLVAIGKKFSLHCVYLVNCIVCLLCFSIKISFGFCM